MDLTTTHNTEDVEAQRWMENDLEIVSADFRGSLSVCSVHSCTADGSIPDMKNAGIPPDASWWKRLLSDRAFCVFCSALVGFGTGVGLSEGKASAELVSWIALFGDLFLQGVKCLVLPLVVISIVLVVRDMMTLGHQVVHIGWKTVVFYLFTSFMGAIEGLCCVLLFLPLFTQSPAPATSSDPFVQLSCPHGDNNVIQQDVVTGALSCGLLLDPSSSQFELRDINEVIVDQDKIAANKAEFSISETIQTSIFRRLIPSNLVTEYADNNFLALIVFAIFFAVASSRVSSPTKTDDGKTKSSQKPPCYYVIKVLEELNGIFVHLIMTLIDYLTYPAVISLVAGAFGAQKGSLAETFNDIGVLVACTSLAMLFHAAVLYPVLFVFFVRENPYVYLRNFAPAMAFAFASSSSAATIPVTNNCASKVKEIPTNIRQFVISLGATINMDGTAIYYSTAVIFLAVSTGLIDQLNVGAYAIIIILSTIGSAGASPVPSMGLIMALIIYNSVFGAGAGTPATYAYIVGIDWLMDRCMTMMNVIGDATTLRIISSIAANAAKKSKSCENTEKAPSAAEAM